MYTFAKEAYELKDKSVNLRFTFLLYSHTILLKGFRNFKNKLIMRFFFKIIEK